MTEENENKTSESAETTEEKEVKPLFRQTQI